MRFSLQSFLGHKDYPIKILDGGYVIKEVLLQHEDIHRERYKDFMDSWLFIWETQIEIYRDTCSAFPNIIEAKKNGLQHYRNYFYKYYSTYTPVLDKLVGYKPENKVLDRREEIKVNNNKKVQDLIDRYVKALKKHCGII